jgi:hypothetical protein
MMLTLALGLVGIPLCGYIALSARSSRSEIRRLLYSAQADMAEIKIGIRELSAGFKAGMVELKTGIAGLKTDVIEVRQQHFTIVDHRGDQ